MSKQIKTIPVDATADAAYAALKAAVEKLRFNVESSDDAARTINITTRVSAFSWGEKITASVGAGENGETVVTLASTPKLATNVADMGRAKRELEAIAKALDEELHGGAPAEKPAAQPVKANGMDFVADEIRKLAQLKDEGLLTEEEFTAKKKQLLGI